MVIQVDEAVTSQDIDDFYGTVYSGLIGAGASIAIGLAFPPSLVVLGIAIAAGAVASFLADATWDAASDDFWRIAKERGFDDDLKSFFENYSAVHKSAKSSVSDLLTFGFELTPTAGVRLMASVVDGIDGPRLVFREQQGSVMTGLAGVDLLYGGDEADSIYGGEGSDHISGGGGFDTLHGEAGDDALMGLSGNDTLEGGAGSDVLTGGEDYDTYVFSASDFNVASGAGFASTSETHGAIEDTIFDMDGAGRIVFDNVAIGDYVASNISRDGLGWETPDRLFRLQVIGSGDDASLMIVHRETGGRIVVKNWSNGDLGITLPGLGQPGTPENPNPQTNGNDLIGKDGDDRPNTPESGNDFISGLAGNDGIDGGYGDDWIDGGHGDRKSVV